MSDHSGPRRGVPSRTIHPGPRSVDPHIIGATALAIGGNQPWMRDAACLDAEPETFYPHPGDIDTLIAAKRICLPCPVRNTCLDHAIDRGEKDGVWGGQTYLERRRPPH